MALLTVQDASNGLASVAFVAASAGGDTVPRGRRGAGWSTGVLVEVRNASAGAVTVTAAGPAGVTRQYIVPATTGTAMIPVHGIYDHVETVTYSAVTSVTVAAVRV